MAPRKNPAPDSSSPDVLGSATLGPVSLRNRIIKAATFEGVTPKGLVTDELISFHRRVAAGGAGMTTVAYLAVSPEGRTHRQQIHLRPEALDGLRDLVSAVHDEGTAIAAQIGHAGPVANAASNKVAALAPSRMLSPLSMGMIKAATSEDIDRITRDFAQGSTLLAEAGFDSIEVHLGHNYLLSAFLSPKLNRRSDRWGGDVEGRARFPRQVLQAVREAVGDRVAVTAKLNMADGVKGGLWLDESLQIARLLESDGCLDALELTGGSSLSNPMYLFRGDVPMTEFAAAMPPAVRLGLKVVGKRFMPAYPFEEAYFLPYARQFRDALDLPLILLGGITKLETAQQAMVEGFGFVAMARSLLREPDLVSKWQAGRTTTSMCVHCNKCMPTIYSGTRCVLVS